MQQRGVQVRSPEFFHITIIPLSILVFLVVISGEFECLNFGLLSINRCLFTQVCLIWLQFLLTQKHRPSPDIYGTFI